VPSSIEVKTRMRSPCERVPWIRVFTSMAESFAPFPYVEEQQTAIEQALSSTRFSNYLKAARGDRVHAAKLYLYNARLAKACLFPLSMVEIVLRNALDRGLASRFGSNWFFCPRARELLPKACVDALVEVTRARKAADACELDAATRGQLIALMPFEFWCGLLRGLSKESGGAALASCFPRAADRADIATLTSLASKLSRFRNRVVHHEPIFEGVDLRQIDQDAITVIRIVCPDTAAWVRHHSTIMHAIRTKPSGIDAFQPLQDVASRDFETCLPFDAVHSVIRWMDPLTRALVVSDGGRPVHLIPIAVLLREIASADEKRCAELLAMSMAQISGALPRTSFMALPGSMAYAAAVELARDRGIRVILSVTEGAVSGMVVLRKAVD
jgi:hypothetical protein